MLVCVMCMWRCGEYMPKPHPIMERIVRQKCVSKTLKTHTASPAASAENSVAAAAAMPRVALHFIHFIHNANVIAFN